MQNGYPPTPYQTPPQQAPAANIPPQGYPQAAPLLSTAYENQDYNGDGQADGRVYLYFTYNAKPGGIYMLSDEEKQAVKMAQEQSYKPEHEKVVKVKFKPFFKRRYAPMDDQLTLEQVETPKEKIQSIGDVTSAEQEQIQQEETLAGQIAAAEDFSPEDAEKMLAEIQQETLDFFEDDEPEEMDEMDDFEESEEKEKHQAE